MARRCRFLTAPPSQHGAPDALVNFHTAADAVELAPHLYADAVAEGICLEHAVRRQKDRPPEWKSNFGPPRHRRDKPISLVDFHTGAHPVIVDLIRFQRFL